MLEQLSISWSRWFTLILLLVALYFVVGLLVGILEYSARQGRFLHLLKKGLKIFQVLLEPFGVGVVLMTFALINPLVNGSLLVVILALSYIPLRNYLFGRFFVLNNMFTEGERIKVNGHEGTIQSVDRVGLRLQIQEGVNFVNYYTLINRGFVKLEGDRLESIKSLEIIPQENLAHHSLQDLKDKIFTCPYTDWYYQPNISTDDTREDGQVVYNARLRVSKDQHLQHLMALIKEWGYTCRVV